MTALLILLALIFGGIAIWAGIKMMNMNHKPPSRPRLHVIAPSPTDARGALMMRQRERNSLRRVQRAF